MRTRIARLLLIIGSIWLGLTPIAAAAAGFTLSLKAGEAVTLPFNFWCIEYGEPFPGSVAVTSDPVPAGIVPVLRAASARGALEGDPYQSILAVWRVTTGDFKDYANLGTELARNIFSDSLKIQVPGVPTATLTLQSALAQGLISVTVTSLTPLVITQPQPLPGVPFTGRGTIEIVNLSQKRLSMLVPEGMIFADPQNAGTQKLVAEAYSLDLDTVPGTGGALPELPAEMIAYAVVGFAFVAAGGGLLIRNSRRRTA